MMQEINFIVNECTTAGLPAKLIPNLMNQLQTVLGGFPLTGLFSPKHVGRVLVNYGEDGLTVN